MKACVHWCGAANLRHNRVPSQFRPPRCITSANQTWERVQNNRLFALTLSIYYGYIVQANSLRANRHIVLHTGTKDTFLHKKKEKSGQTECWETTCGNRDSTWGGKLQKSSLLPACGWGTNTISIVLENKTVFFSGFSKMTDVSPVTWNFIGMLRLCSGSAGGFSLVSSISQAERGDCDRDSPTAYLTTNDKVKVYSWQCRHFVDPHLAWGGRRATVCCWD